MQIPEHNNVGGTFPFTAYDMEGGYYVHAGIEGDVLYPYYADVFEKHGYSGNGECWAGHIAAILLHLDTGLLHRINFDPEAGLFAAKFNFESDRSRFLQLLCPIFTHIPTLESWIMKADRDAIDD
ncbi:Imm51 family immunity protein [Chitinophaga sp. NPDC101104]|uniref:Imm51 family immunity protein n=1 Tax=Chitinophaga sp. NPDC101104 TaxID=3390561 RepID=UPI003CFCEE07